MERRVTIPAGHGYAFVVPAGKTFTVINTEGQQVVDLIAFNAANFEEYLSTSHTIAMNRSIQVTAGDTLYTNFRQPILEILEDDTKCNDLLLAACDPVRYSLAGHDGHRSCRANLLEALARWEVPYSRIPNPVNLFQNTPVQADGRIAYNASPAKPGDRIVIRANMQALVGLSCCPFDLEPINGAAVTPVDVVIQ